MITTQDELPSIGVLSFFLYIRYSILSSCRDINQTSCESRGCCYQELNLEYNGPVCHRKIPSLHSMRVLKNEKGGSEEERPYNDSTADLEYSHPDNLQPWPFTNLTEATQHRYKYRIRSLAPHHLEIHIHQGDIEDEEVQRGFSYLNFPLELQHWPTTTNSFCICNPHSYSYGMPLMFALCV